VLVSVLSLISLKLCCSIIIINIPRASVAHNSHNVDINSEVYVVCRYYDQLNAIEGKLPIAENQVGLIWWILTRCIFLFS